MKNERTSKSVAKIAGEILRLRRKRRAITLFGDDYNDSICVKWSDIRALAASALTQTKDKPKRKAKRLKRK